MHLQSPGDILMYSVLFMSNVFFCLFLFFKSKSRELCRYWIGKGCLLRWTLWECHMWLHWWALCWRLSNEYHTFLRLLGLELLDSAPLRDWLLLHSSHKTENSASPEKILKWKLYLNVKRNIMECIFLSIFSLKLSPLYRLGMFLELN